MAIRTALILSLFLSFPMIAATADLGVYVPGYIPPLTFDPGERFRLSVQAFSNGPDPAEHARLTVSLPPGTTVVDVQSQLGPCAQQGNDLVCASETPLGKFQITTTLILEAPRDPAGQIFTFSARVSSDATDPNPVNDIFTATITTRHTFTVDTDADSGPGSLRAAIPSMNASCGTALPCKIVFAKGMTIEPLSPLPSITSCNSGIDAGGAFGAPPRVVLSGTKLREGSGLEIHTTCRGSSFPLPGVTIRGLAIDGFPQNGIGVLGGERQPGSVLAVNHVIQECAISGNGYRGIATAAPDANVNIFSNTISGNVASGVAFYSVGTANVGYNHIESNGASGVFAASGVLDVIGNEIRNNGQYGISTLRNASFVGSGNVIHDNGAQPIDLMMDGPSRGGTVRPPTLTDAFYDAANDRTVIRGRLFGNNDDSPTNEGIFRIAFAATSARNAAGFYDAERNVAASAAIVPIKRGDFDIAFETTLKGDLRGQYLTAVTTYSMFGDSPPLATSELSDAVLVH